MAQVPATTYGLNILEVLAAPEKELNQVVGMKKLAPYREDGGLVRPNYAKLRQMQVPNSVTQSVIHTSSSHLGLIRCLTQTTRLRT